MSAHPSARKPRGRVAAFVAHGEAAKAMEPSERALDDPARAAQVDCRADVRAARELRAMPRAPAGRGAVASRSRDRLGPRGARAGRPGRPLNGGSASTSGSNAVMSGQLAAVSCATSGMPCASVRSGVSARLAAIGWVRSSFFPPRSARTDALSTTARRQIQLAASAQLGSSTSCNRLPDARPLPRHRRRQHVLPEPQPISRGSSSRAGRFAARTGCPSARRDRNGGPPRILAVARGARRQQRFDQRP